MARTLPIVPKSQRTRGLARRVCASLPQFALASVALAALSGCGSGSFIDALIDRGHASKAPDTGTFKLATRAFPGTAAKARPKDTYLAARAPRSGAGFVFGRPPVRLRPPFKVTVVQGLFDPANAGADATGLFGIELDLEGAAKPPAKFFGLFSQKIAGGISAFANANGTNLSGSRPFAAQELEVEIEHDGTDMIFRARIRGDAGAFSEIGRTRPGTLAGPLAPGLGMFNRTDGSVAGFDEFRVVSNGPRPGDLPAAELAVEELNDAWLAVMEVFYRTDLVAPDAAQVTAALTAADVQIGEALDALAALSPPGAKPTPAQKAAGLMRHARSVLSKAATKLASMGITAARPVVVAAFKKALIDNVKAIDLVLPDSLRATMPGAN